MNCGRNRILFARLNALSSLKYNILNQTWLKSSNAKCLIKNRFSSDVDEILVDATESDDILIENNAQQKSSSNASKIPPVKKDHSPIEKLFLSVVDEKNCELSPSDVVTIFSRVNILCHTKKPKTGTNFRSNLKQLYLCNEFQNLCEKLKCSLEEIDTDDLLLLIFFFKNHKVPDYFLSIQEIIEEIHHRKEKLLLRQTVLLYHILLDNLENKFASDLKREYESFLLSLAAKKINSEILWDKLDVLEYGTMFPLPQKFKIKLLHSILDLGAETWCKFSITKKFINLFHMVKSNEPDFSILKKRLFKILMDCSSNSHFAADVPSFINTLTKLAMFNKIEYGSETFDMLINTALKSNIQYDDKMYILLPLLRLKHINQELILSLLKEMKERPELMNASVCSALMKSLMYINFKSKNNELEILFNYVDSFDVNTQEWPLSKFLLFTSCSVCLGHFPDKLLKAVSEIVHNERFSIKKHEVCEEILALNKAISLWHQSYSDQFLSEEKLLWLKDKCNELRHRENSILTLKVKKLIESAVMIEDCVLTDCPTLDGFAIDQVMVLNRHGEPIKLYSKNNKKITYVEDIFVPPNHKLVYIFNFYHYMTCRNIFGLRSRHWLRNRILKESGGIVIYTIFTLEKNVSESDPELGKDFWNQIKNQCLSKMQKLSVDECDTPITVPFYPYLMRPRFQDLDVVIPSQKEWLQGFLSTLEGQIWYTDGCIHEKGAGSGIYFPEGDLELSVNLEADSIIDTETNGILQCAKEAYLSVEKNKGKDAKPVVNIVTDSQPAIRLLTEDHIICSLSIQNCINTVSKLSEIATVRLIWSPGHFGITGNMIADSLAKKGAAL